MKYKTINNDFITNAIVENNCLPNTTPNLLGETYSQCYEDVILTSMLMVEQLQNPKPIQVIEIGGNHPIANSNSLLLEKLLNAECVIVEAIPKLSQIIQKHRPLATVVNQAVIVNDNKYVTFYIGTHNEVSGLDETFIKEWHNKFNKSVDTSKIQVPAVNINDLLAKYLKDVITVLSIDCEGFDLQILQHIDYTKYQPTYICVEYVTPNGSLLKDLQLILTNYELCAITDVNAIFRRKK